VSLTRLFDRPAIWWAVEQAGTIGDWSKTAIGRSHPI